MYQVNKNMQKKKKCKKINFSIKQFEVFIYLFIKII